MYKKFSSGCLFFNIKKKKHHCSLKFLVNLIIFFPQINIFSITQIRCRSTSNWLPINSVFLSDNNKRINNWALVGNNLIRASWASEKSFLKLPHNVKWFFLRKPIWRFDWVTSGKSRNLMVEFFGHRIFLPWPDNKRRQTLFYRSPYPVGFSDKKIKTKTCWKIKKISRKNFSYKQAPKMLHSVDAK